MTDSWTDRPSRGSNHERILNPDHPGVRDGSRARVSRHEYSPDARPQTRVSVRALTSLSSQSESPPHTFKILPLSGARAATVTVSRATSYKLGPRDGVTGHGRQHTRA